MIIVRKTIKTEDGNYEVTFSLGEEQVNYLLTFAINQLLSEGVIAVHDASEDGANEVLSKYLETLNPEDMSKA